MIARGITLYLVRHGETVWNTERRYQGSKHDSPLTELGRTQARAVAGILKKHLDVASPPSFIVSPAMRAQTTMQILLAELGIQCGHTTDAQLAEIDLGAWSGFTAAQVRESDPGAWAVRNADRWNVPIPGGESYKDAAERATSFLRGLAGDAVAVSHGGFGRILRGVVGGLNVDEISALDEPQDCVFRLRGNTIDRLTIETENAP